MSPRIRLLVFVVALAALAFLGRAAWGDRFEPSAVIAGLREAGSSEAAVPLFFGMFVLATSMFAPAMALMLAAGVTWGWWPGALIVWGAATLATQLHFFVGRWVAGELVGKLLDSPRLKWLRRELEHGGVLATIMIRQVPMPFLLVNLAGGASPMPWSRWFIGNAIGLIPNCIIYTQLAATIVSGAEGGTRELATRVVLSTTLVLASSLVARWVQRRLGAAAAAK